MKVFSVVVCAILLAGANAATVVNRDAGSYYAFSVFAIGQTIVTCRLKTPAGDTLDFTPGQTSQYGDRYQLQPISETLPSCSVLLTNLQSSDNGLWEISFVNTAGSGSSETYQLVVSGTESQESKESEEINENDNIQWLNTIEFPTRINQIVDISLPRIDHEEECTVRTPDKQYIETSKVIIEGVTVHESSYFVSCRITIGPMVESFLGEWTICGKHTENNKEHKRCQLAKIYWNQNHPDTSWQSNVQPKFEHPVHFDSTLTPAVIGHGDVVACHIITPSGEDLVIRQDSMYPSIKGTSAHSICSFAVGPLHRGLLGDWVIYGLFRNLIQGLNEERLPFHMFLYDEEDPSNQAYNLTVLDPVIRAVNMGNTLNVEVSVTAGQVDSCYFKTPSGDVYKMGQEDFSNGASFVEGDDRSVACRVTIGPITKGLLGDWKITGKFSNNGVFTERQQTFHLVQEDPENPIQEDRQVIYLTAETANIEIGQSDRLVIPSNELINGESCLIRTPNGLQYQIMKGFTSVDGVEVIEEDGVECGIIITAISEDVIGDWTLIARASQHSQSIERRLPFTIYVTESVEALQKEITLTEGDDLYVSLKYPIVNHETCKLIGPYGFECQAAVRDPQQMETCGFIRRNVQFFNTGTWTITFGERIGYKAEIAVIVNGGDSTTPVPISTSTSVPSSTSTLSVVRDRSVEQDVGPENAVYCRLEDPQGLAIFDGFGRCHLSLDKVGLEHHGNWKMLIATPGKILTEEHLLAVNVRESGGKTAVTTNVTQDKPIVTITCSVQTNDLVTGCKFRNPQGKILIAASGLAEDRYDFHGKGVSYESGVRSHECGIRITDPVLSDLGLWRCALETVTETYYGHMPVLCPFALADPANAALVQQEPILRATRSLVDVVEEEPATMSCSVESVIRYCYFRASNGTTFTVTPGMSSPSMEYVGAGFDAGECGIRFHGMNAPDSGRWSCHVGLDGSADEQRDQFQVTVHERMRVRHFTSHSNIMTVEGIVHEGRALEYCRFVRIDGFGFTTDNMPSQYVLTGILANGECQFTARDPTILDLHPWTIAARIRGQDVEIAKDTMESVIIGAPEGPAPEPENNPDNPGVVIITNNSNAFFVFLYVFLSLLLVSIVLGGLLGPKKNREWTSQRASAFRRSLSGSFKRQQRQDPAPTYTP